MIRQPAVAGTFYPASAAVLEQTLAGLVKTSLASSATGRPKALIAPHAGYVYSGAVAGEAYARLVPYAGLISRVVLLGPAHRVALRGLAVPASDRFATPLGEIPLDRAAIRRIEGMAQVSVSEAAHEFEHSLEVQLPFLQRVLRDFTLVPLAVGDATAEEVAEVLEALWGGPETLIVVSSDLSHYLPYDEARRKDDDTVALLLQRRPLDSFERACGALPINGLLLAAGRHKLTPRLVAQCNSGDTAGDRQRVVGYAAIEFDEAGGDRGPVLLALARASIASAFGDSPDAERTSRGFQESWLQEKAACFVTLKRGGALRGCVGDIEARRPLNEALTANARAAAFEDPRFAPLAADELAGTTIEVSLLSPLSPLPARSEAEALRLLRPKVDGLVLTCGRHRATFLPQVWDTLPEPRDFLRQLKLKAGLRADFWSEEIHLDRYRVNKWSEPEVGPNAQ
ncbi:AmmeMemoRadiSam system protein B [uncultured Rhodoblastus sp.]|uniref:AmmeMemoRadiSam system protein B n=1 Tax=uncultured Rhodoblastus sp. TaxID=543037 RepID=UPI0025EFE849|nr:AmmeMemoRadiSam system protein B [uncultured Rhodoblastus sp.]